MKTTLKVKLAIAFVIVALITGAVVALVFNRFNSKQFADFVIDSQRQELIQLLSEYYQENGTWQGAEFFFNSMPRVMMQDNMQGKGQGRKNAGQGPRFGQGGNLTDVEIEEDDTLTVPGRLFGLATTDGTVIIALPGGTPAGKALNTAVIESSDPIIVDKKTVGYLLTVDQFPGYSLAEAQFIKNSNRSLWLALLGATIVAAVVGFFIARGITKPLETLTQASQRIANRELNTKVPQLSHDEIGTLAETFNHMSERLEESDRLRKQMTADIAHDLRTPLTIIGGYVESMRDGDLKATPERLEIIADETSRLSNLVNDLRLLSIADAGELSLQLQLTNPNALLNYSLQLFEVQAARKNINLELSSMPGNAQILVDEDRMIQVFSNLMSNAIEYSPEGSLVMLRASEEKAQILLEVIDSGPGINEEDLPYVFERFHRADRARQHSEQHSGLGLAIAKEIVKAHKGEISLKSVIGKGTTIEIRLPKH